MKEPRTKTTQIVLRLPLNVGRTVKLEAAKRHISMNTIIVQALQDRYDPEKAGTEQLLTLKEIRALDKRMGAVNFSNRVLVELFTLTMKNLFATLTPPTAAQRSAGEGFYTALLAAVAKNLSEDTPVLERITAMVMRANDSQFSALDPGAGKEPQ